ncbi:hypothetical protein [Hyphomicrobium sp. D-2]|uniref:hypothetical protein n=1 Tax=Hyphomicrobium sp. D-2 TaxID=3041621 RepID=UPI00245415D6|nr:hypothetical protein [Hyphomicrobium sp. D-2]MDH4983894.1 hypothetical protein [Hyphomicrobium sp. D-2]
MLKVVVAVLAVLAVAKLWAQDRLYRDGAEEALLQAYRDRAIAACQSAPPEIISASAMPLWTQPASVDLVIGRADVDVRIWQLDSEQWPARFRHPHVVLTLDDRATPICRYDVIEGRAYVTPM